MSDQIEIFTTFSDSRRDRRLHGRIEEKCLSLEVFGDTMERKDIRGSLLKAGLGMQEESKIMCILVQQLANCSSNPV